MPDSKVDLGGRLRVERERRGWSRSAMAGRLRGAAEATVASRLPNVHNLSHMIKEWEGGKHEPTGVYPHLYALAFDLALEELFTDGARGTAGRRGPDVADSFKAAWTIGNGCGSSEVTAGAGISHASYLAPGLAVSVRD